MIGTTAGKFVSVGRNPCENRLKFCNIVSVLQLLIYDRSTD
jgi:hypothetical protein